MATIIAVFQKYSEREGERHKLKKSELRDLLHDELPGLLGVRRRNASEPSFLLEPYCALGNSRSSFTELEGDRNESSFRVLLPPTY